MAEENMCWLMEKAVDGETVPTVVLPGNRSTVGGLYIQGLAVASSRPGFLFSSLSMFGYLVCMP
jgi:hypothetical protein